MIKTQPSLAPKLNLASHDTEAALTGTRAVLPAKRHLRTLDGWRSIALAMVLLCHSAAGFYDQPAYFALSVPRYGSFALDMFFGLSGLLICKLFLEEFDRNGSIKLPGFYAKRFCRIFLTCAIFTLILFALGLIKTNWELASCFLFFRNLLPYSLGGHYTAHLWSLAIEEHFYMLLPAALVFIGVQRSLGWLIAAALTCEAWRTIDLHFHLFSRLIPEVAPGGRTDLRLDSFLWGCVAAYLIHNQTSAAWLSRRFTQVIWYGVLGLCIFCIEYQPPLVETWTAILIPLLLVGPLLHLNWPISRVLEFFPLRYLGRISYSFYIWQQVFLLPKWEPVVRGLRLVQVFPMNLLAVIVSSVAGYYFIELPLTRLGQTIDRRISARAHKRADAKPSSVHEKLAGDPERECTV